MKLSEHFSRSEFACKDACGFATADVKLIEVLEVVREHFGKPVIVNSACRCSAYNKKVGGAKASKHMQGIAADIVVKGVAPVDVYNFLNGYMGNCWGGLGNYRSFTHVDVRDNPARWRG